MYSRSVGNGIDLFSATSAMDEQSWLFAVTEKGDYTTSESKFSNR